MKTARIFIFVILPVLFLIGCRTMSEREKTILAYSESSGDSYDQYLIKQKQYTSSGVVFHKRYYKYLRGVAKMIIDEKKYHIVRNSIGFYYDKKSHDKSKLYLGLDLDVEPDSELVVSKYGNRALSLLKKYTPELLKVVFSCESIFSEDDVVGIVIGLRWKVYGEAEVVNIWVDKKDIIRFEKTELSLSEIIDRNVITDTNGKVIRLQ